MLLKQYFADFIDLCFPKLCLVCGHKLSGSESFMCSRCMASLPETYFDVASNNKTRMVFAGKIPVRYASSYLYFKQGSPYKNLIHQLKYNNKPELGVYFGRLMGQYLKPQIEHIDYLVPVPLHPKKEKQRGYNQAERFAAGLSEILNIPLATGQLFRRKYTETQTKKNKEERQKNVAGVFELSHSDFFNHKHIALVDDVITTGATITESALAILEKSNPTISIFSIGIAD